MSKQIDTTLICAFIVYIDIGPLAGDVVNLNFAFTGQSTNRVWDIKVSQIPCGINKYDIFFLIKERGLVSVWIL